MKKKLMICLVVVLAAALGCVPVLACGEHGGRGEGSGPVTDLKGSLELQTDVRVETDGIPGAYGWRSYGPAIHTCLDHFAVQHMAFAERWANMEQGEAPWAEHAQGHDSPEGEGAAPTEEKGEDQPTGRQANKLDNILPSPGDIEWDSQNGTCGEKQTLFSWRWEAGGFFASGTLTVERNDRQTNRSGYLAVFPAVLLQESAAPSVVKVGQLLRGGGLWGAAENSDSITIL